MDTTRLAKELSSGLDDLLLIDPEHLYADLLRDAIEAIRSLEGDVRSATLRHGRAIEAMKGEQTRLEKQLEEANAKLKARTRDEYIIHHGRLKTARVLADELDGARVAARKIAEDLGDARDREAYLAQELEEARKELRRLGVAPVDARDAGNQLRIMCG